MKKLLAACIALSIGSILGLGSSAAQADTSGLFVGPSLGATSFSSADGSPNRDTQISYGADGFYIYDHFAAGLTYKYLANYSDGNPAINTAQSTNWLSVEAKYLILNQVIDPYVSVGAGPVMQTLTTTVVGASENTSGVFLARDLGIGVMGRFSKDGNVGFNFGARYFQYSNVNGFDYVVSIGFFPEF